MSYTLNKSDGTILIELIDGVIDTSTTDLSLVGRNSSGFGESINENFIKLLENFASASEPQLPLTGQLWFDTTEGRLKVFDEIWKVSSGTAIQTDQPILANSNAGDMWYDEGNKQLKIFNGSSFITVGPNYSANYGQTETVGDYITDVQGRNVAILKVFVGGTFVGLFSNQQFAINDARYESIVGLDTDLNGKKLIRSGFNTLLAGFKYNGTATNAESLNGILADNFVRTDISSTMEANLNVKGGDGITFGTIYKASPDDGQNFVLQNLINNRNLYIRAVDQGTVKDAVSILPTGTKVGIFNATPEAMLHVGTSTTPGNVIVEGNLTVKGSTTTVTSTEVAIKDINLELGSVTTPTNDTANGGGITLKGATDHTIKWYNTATPKWELNDNLNIPNAKGYYIDDSLALSTTTLGDSVINSSLTSVGTLSSLSVSGSTTLSNITLNGNTISATGSIVLSPGSAIYASNKLIRDVLDPQLAQDAATKKYVDDLLSGYTQSSNFAAVATSGDYDDLVNTPDLSIYAVLDGNNQLPWSIISPTGRPTTRNGYGITDAASSSQGTKADSAVQPGDNVSDLVNDANYVASGSNVSVLANDANYVAQGGLFDGDMKGSVFADDSTLLVDGVNGVIPWSVVTNTPTTIAGYGITDAFDGSYNSLSDQPAIPLLLEDLSDVNITGTTTTNYVLTWNGAEWVPAAAGGGGSATLSEVTANGATTADAISITNATASTSTTTGALTVTGGVGVAGNVWAGSVTIDNKLAVTGTTSTSVKVNATGGTTYTMDYTGSPVLKTTHYFTALTSNVTIALQNLPTTEGIEYNFEFIVEQGATAYLINALTIEGTPVTLLKSSASGGNPAGTPSTTESFSLRVIRANSAWTSLIRKTTYFANYTGA